MKDKLNKNRKGFTLTELIVVIVIIGILAAVLVPSLTGYIKKAKRSNDVQVTSEMTREIKNYCAEFQINESNLLGTDIRTICIARGFDLRPNSEEWTFVYNKESKKIEIMDIEILQKMDLNFGAGTLEDNALDPTQISSNLFLIGKGKHNYEKAIEQLCTMTGVDKYLTIATLAPIVAEDGQRNLELQVHKLVEKFNPQSTLFLTNATTFTSAELNDQNSETIDNVLYIEGTSSLPLIDEATFKELSSKAKNIKSAIIKTSETGSLLKTAMYPTISYINEDALKKIRFNFITNSHSDDTQDVKVKVVIDELINESMSQTFSDEIINVELIDINGQQFVKTTRKFIISYFNGNGCFARGIAYYSTTDSKNEI